MSSEWQEFKLCELCNVTSSKRIFAHDYVDSGIPFYRSKDIIEKALGTFTGIEIFISEKRFNDIANKFGSPKEGDLLLSSVGNRSGIPYVIQKEGEFYFKDGNLTWFKDFNNLNSMFLYYWLISNYGQSSLNSIMIGSAQKALTISGLLELRIKVPKLDSQNNIVSLLRSLDDRITLLRDTNTTLEAIAQALFKSWFVNFDPIRAKQEGREPEGMDTDTAALFPDSFEESELGLVPKGWRASKLGNEVATVLGGTPSRTKPAYWGGTIPWINSGKANEFRIFEPSEFITKSGLDSSSTKIMPSRTTVIAITGATLGQISLTEIETCANQSIVGVLGTEALPSELIYFWTKEHVKDLLASQTGGAQQHINKNNVNDLPVLCPNEKVVSAFKELARPIFDRIKSCCFESQTLATLRDTLLPRLISGQLRLPDAEALIEEATA